MSRIYKKGTGFEFWVKLLNPTTGKYATGSELNFAVGDFKIIGKNKGSAASARTDLATMPVETPSGSGDVLITVTDAEANYDSLLITFQHQAAVLDDNSWDCYDGSNLGLSTFDASTDTVQIDPAITADIDFLVQIMKNKKEVRKEGSTWYLCVRDSGDTSDILKKALKDSSGNDISDLLAGQLAQELGTSV